MDPSRGDPTVNRCALCGTASPDVAVVLIRYREPDEEGNRFGRLPHCRDRRSCRARVEALGKAWMLDDCWWPT